MPNYPRVRPYKIIQVHVYPHFEERITLKQNGRWVRGTTSNLSITAYIAFLLELNEYMPKEHKLTDYQLCRAIIREFPHRPRIQRLRPQKTLESKTEDTLTYWRARYNRGDIFPDRRPRTGPISFRYDENGDRLGFFGAKKLLTQEGYEQALRQYGHDNRPGAEFDWKEVKARGYQVRKKNVKRKASSHPPVVQ
jgi:hypothetical protein